MKMKSETSYKNDRFVQALEMWFANKKMLSKDDYDMLHKLSFELYEKAKTNKVK